MKNWLLFFLLLISGLSQAQTKYIIQADSTLLRKVGGSNELIIENSTKATTGVLVNYGNGRTRFSKPRINGDTLFVGVDTILGVGASGTAWKLTGNAGTTAGTNFWGTTDDVDAIGKRNSIEIFRMGSAGIGITTAVPASKLHITTDNLVSTVTDASGIFLENSTAATNAVRAQASPGIVWKGSAWTTSSGGSNQTHLWRASVLPSFSASSTTNSTWKLQTSINGVAYSDALTFLTGSQVANLRVLQYNSTVLGRVNDILMGINGLNNRYVGSIPLSTATGTNNISMGSPVFAALTSGDDNIGIGNGALNLNTSGDNNVAIGDEAMGVNTTGFYNTGVGYHSMFTNTSGEQNAAFGMNTLLAQTTAIKNTAIGAGAMEETTTGGFNTGLGMDALLHNTTGIENTGVGWLGWSQNITGSNNVGLGSSSGRSVVNGSFNTALGSQSMYGGSQEDTVRSTIALGFNARTTRNNQFALSDSALSFTFRGISRGGANDVLWDSLGNGEYWVGRAISSLVSTPTWQQTLTAGSTLTGDNDVNGADTRFDFNNFNEVDWTDGNLQERLYYGTNAETFLYSRQSGGNRTSLTLHPDSAILASNIGDIRFRTLTNLSTQNRLIGQLGTNGQIGYVTIGSGLSMPSGVLQTDPSSNYNNQTGTSYTLVAGDNGKIVTLDNGSAITLTVPAGLPAGFNCTIVQLGAGVATVTPSSTTVNNSDSFTQSGGQYSAFTILMYASNTFLTQGKMQ